MIQYLMIQLKVVYLLLLMNSVMQDIFGIKVINRYSVSDNKYESVRSWQHESAGK